MPSRTAIWAMLAFFVFVVGLMLYNGSHQPEYNIKKEVHEQMVRDAEKKVEDANMELHSIQRQ